MITIAHENGMNSKFLQSKEQILSPSSKSALLVQQTATTGEEGTKVTKYRKVCSQRVYLHCCGCMVALIVVKASVHFWNLKTYLREHLPPALGGSIESRSIPFFAISKVGVVWVWMCGC